jgi:hypothetical protein
VIARVPFLKIAANYLDSNIVLDLAVEIRKCELRIVRLFLGQCNDFPPTEEISPAEN